METSIRKATTLKMFKTTFLKQYDHFEVLPCDERLHDSCRCKRQTGCLWLTSTATSFSVNSLLLHIDELRFLANEYRILVLCINGTKLSSEIKNEVPYIKGYKLYRQDRNKHKGGVAVRNRFI